MAACAGRLLVEVFEDAAPLAARHFLNRCREGSSEGLQGTCLHRLVPDLGFFFGTSRGCGAAGADSPQLLPVLAVRVCYSHVAVRQTTQPLASTGECRQGLDPGDRRNLCLDVSTEEQWLALAISVLTTACPSPANAALRVVLLGSLPLLLCEWSCWGCRHRGGAAVRRYPGLHHLAAGLVSVSRGGEEVAITLAKALALDPTHQARSCPADCSLVAALPVSVMEVCKCPTAS